MNRQDAEGAKDKKRLGLEGTQGTSAFICCSFLTDQPPTGTAGVSPAFVECQVAWTVRFNRSLSERVA